MSFESYLNERIDSFKAKLGVIQSRKQVEYNKPIADRDVNLLSLLQRDEHVNDFCLKELLRLRMKYEE